MAIHIFLLVLLDKQMYVIMKDKNIGLPFGIHICFFSSHSLCGYTEVAVACVDDDVETPGGEISQ